MMLLPLKSLVVEAGRQRQAFDEGKMQELAQSILKPAGLLHPLVVRREADGAYKLLSGERRLRAIEQIRFLGKKLRHGGQEIPDDQLPCVDVGVVDELTRMEAEYDENKRRENLTWQEDAAAAAKLQALRQGQHNKAVVEAAPFSQQVATEKAASVAALAVELRGSASGSAIDTTRKELIVAKHMADPDVKGAKTLDEAYKVLKRKEDVKQRVQQAALVGATFTVDLHKALNTDSLAWMKAYTGELFDVILSDPPYGMGADQFGDSGGMAAGAHTYDDSYENWKKLMEAFAKLSYNITKPAAHMYLFCDFDRFHELKGLLDAEGWQVFRTPLVWVKPGGSRLPWVDFGPQRKYELCLYANKGRKPVTKIFPDVVSYNPDQNLGHNAQKPVDLFVDLLKRSVAPGNRVLDPFAGSGPIFPAAHELKCEATGIELDPAAYALCLNRLEKLKAQGELNLTDLSGLKG
jgi:ParB/RepB/Spo0J family partition protein